MGRCKRSAQHAVVFGALLPACGIPESLWLPREEARTLLLAQVSAGGATVRVDAMALTAGQPLTLPIDAVDARELYAIRSHSTLDELGLSAGQLRLVDRGRALPPADEPLLRARLEAGHAEAWTVIEALPSGLASLRVEGRGPCASFEVRDFSLPGTRDLLAQFVVPLDADTALVGLSGGRFFRVHAAGVEALTDLSTTTPSLSAVRDPRSGELWLASADGRLVHGSLESGFRAGPSIPLAAVDPTLQLAGGPGGSGFELYAVSDAHELLRMEGDHWVSLFRAGTVQGERYRVRLAWSAPGMVYALGFGDEVVLSYEQGRARSEGLDLPVQLTNPDAVFSVGVVEGLGPVTGTRYGLLYVREGPVWSMLPVPPSNGRVYVATALGGGVLFGGQAGVMTQYLPDGRYCDPTNIAAFDVEHLVPLGDGMLLVESGEPGVEIRATRLGWR